MDFDRATKFTLGIEGGYANNPNDKGGATNLGISTPTLNSAIRNGIVPKGTTVKTLTKEQALTIYKKVYWDSFGLDTIPWPFSLLIFDAAVHHGAGDSVRFMQKAGNTVGKNQGLSSIKPDGKWGPITRSLVITLANSDAISLAENALIERKNYMDTIFVKTPSQLTFKAGWYRRIRDLAKECGVASPVN